MKFSYFTLTLVAIIAVSHPADAYIGFGPGMTMIGSFFSLLLALLAMLVMILILPLRMLLRRRRERSKQSQNPPEA